MNEVCKAFPQEWPTMLPVLKYVYDTAPQGVRGLSAFDMSTGYALASSVDARLAPCMAPQGLPETEIAARLFSRFRELYGVLQRLNQESPQKMQDYVNRAGHYRSLDPGE
eukprot:6095494-Alexandrium_andersonii.AAC.1